jgi:hypothetical protein
MLSSQATLKGQGMKPDQLLNILFHSIFNTDISLDDSFMALQINFTNRILELVEEEKLNARLKSSLLAFQNGIHKLAKKKSKTGEQTLKNHFQYLKIITENSQK